MPRNPDPLKIKKPARPGHGGSRPGAGAKPGSGTAPVTRRSKQVANDIAEGKRFVEEETGKPLPKDATPLDVLMMAMHRAYMLGGSLAAAPYAEKCAPYIHARLANIQQTGKNNGPIVISFAWATGEPDPTE